MVSIIDTLLNRNDVVVYDSESHACILDGLRLHIGKRFVYAHNDMESLRKQLEHATHVAETTGGGILVITEGVFGMAGDLGKLDEIAALKKDFRFRILVDDAHGFGTMGKRGAGTGEHFGVQDQIDLYFATFAKAMAGIGGFIAGERDVIDYLQYNMRSQIFAKSLPMPMVEGALKRRELLQTRPEVKDNLWIIVRALQMDFGPKDSTRQYQFTRYPCIPLGKCAEATNIIFDLRENYGIFFLLSCIRLYRKELS
jgi:glycine C-acetyltransferase